MVSLATLIPLLLGVVLAAVALQYAMKKKLAAQAMCVSHGLRLQASLRTTLDKLLKLNPQATRLRAQKIKAERALRVAIATANGPAVTAARAALVAIHVQQVALAAQQQGLLAQAQVDRMRMKSQLRSTLRLLHAQEFSAHEFHSRALAVEPRPATSLTPDYVPVRGFAEHQAQEFSFSINVSPKILDRVWTQASKCVVTLKGQEGQWRVQIAAGSAP